MALLRVLHAADLPDPGTLARKLEELAARAPSAPAPVNTNAPEVPAPVAALDWAALVKRVDAAGQLRVAQVMRDWIRPVEVLPGLLRFHLAEGLAEDPSPDLRDALLKATGERWQVERTVGEAQPSLRELAEAEERSAQAAILANPLVKAAFAAFPDAELIDESRASPRDSNPPWSKSA